MHGLLAPRTACTRSSVAGKRSRRPPPQSLPHTLPSPLLLPLPPLIPADQAIAVAVNAIKHAVDGIHIDGRGLRHLKWGGRGVTTRALSERGGRNVTLSNRGVNGWRLRQLERGGGGTVILGDRSAGVEGSLNP